MRILLLSLIILMYSNVANAVRSSGSSAIYIIDPVEVNDVTGFQPFEIIKTNKIINRILAAISQGYEFVEQLPASEYRVTGSRENSIQINVVSNDPDAAVKIEDFVVNYKDGEVSQVSINQPAPGKYSSIKLEARLKVASNAKIGFHSPSFQVAIYYE